MLFYAGDLANVFFAVTVGTGLYWLIFYKVSLIPLGLSFMGLISYLSGLQYLLSVAFFALSHLNFIPFPKQSLFRLFLHELA